MNTILLSVSVALLAGLLMTRLFKPFKLPDVTAYLIAGVLIGPSCIGALTNGAFGFANEGCISFLKFKFLSKSSLISSLGAFFSSNSAPRSM